MADGAGARGAGGGGRSVNWWEKDEGIPNMVDVESVEGFLGVLQAGEEKLVIVDFYATWCGACRALFPKLCKLARDNDNLLIAKVNFDRNKPMCKSLGIRVLPFFHFYHGADGKVAEFSASVKKFHLIREAIANHGSEYCNLVANGTVDEIQRVFLEAHLMPGAEEAEAEAQRAGEPEGGRRAAAPTDR